MTGGTTRDSGLDGVYTVANDRMLPFLETFLTSLRVFSSKVPVAIIPFNDDIKGVREYVADKNCIVIEPDNVWDEIGERLYGKEEYRPGIPAARYFRKLNAFSGPYERFAFLDVNTVVLGDIQELWALSMTPDTDIMFVGDSAKGRTIKSNELTVVVNVLSPGIKAGYNAGAFLSCRGVVDRQASLIISRNPRLRDVFGKAPEQAFLTWYIAVNALRHGKVGHSGNKVQLGSWATQFSVVEQDGRYWFAEGPSEGRQVYVLKWTGQDIKSSGPGKNNWILEQFRARSQVTRSDVGDGEMNAGPANNIAATNARDIDDAQLEQLKELTATPDLLRELVARARETIGFFTKHVTRVIEYPWVVKVLEDAGVRSVLDIGAGVSVLPIRFADKGIKAYTVDYSSNIRTLESKVSWTEWGFLDYSMLNKEIRSFNTELAKVHIDNKIDACYSVSVLEHMPKGARRSMLESAAQLVRTGGLFVITLDLVKNSHDLWNRDRGRIVEEPKLHGDLNAFIHDAHAYGWALEQLQIRRNIPGAATDVAMCVLRRQNDARDTELAEKFSDVYRRRKWPGGGEETVSGAGSTLAYTSLLRPALEAYLRSNGVKSILDAPCGDFNWFKEVNLPDLRYVGMDIVEDLIRRNSDNYASSTREFRVGDITRDPLPLADVMLCRDCLMHLPFKNCFDFFDNFLRSGIDRLLLTSHENIENSDLSQVAGFRRINFQLSPFNFPEPQLRMKDFQTGYPKRSVCLWTAEEIRAALNERT